ncbi:MAG: substrate-binding domain-containing protein [Betaproteobacteria bacterium]|nr:substrate-binding domain-containing protein [Betaproteobacteria bacterium]
MPGKELKVLSAGAVKRGVAQVAKEFERATGTRVTVEFSTAPEMRKRVAAGETADVFVVPPAVMDEFQQQGKIAADSRGFVGRSRMGVVVPANTLPPALADTADFTRAVRAASAVAHNRASSGLYAAKLLEKLKLTKELGPRIVVVDTGAAIMEYVAAQPPGAVGLAQISEIMVLIDKGCAVQLAAPLPDEIQNVTSYDAAATAASKFQDAARKLAASLTSAEAKKVFAATGIH